MKTYHHLSLEERERVYALKEQGLSFRDIAKVLSRDHTTVSREYSRNAKYGRVYIPCRAQNQADKRAEDQRYQAPLKEPLIFLYVREHLRKPYRWSPETIAGRLILDHLDKRITKETIYQYIYSKKARGYHLWENLALSRKKRRKARGRGVHRESRIPEAVSIDLRPAAVNLRIRVGDWESDNMEGIRGNRKAVSVTVERVTKATLLDLLPTRKAFSKTMALTHRLGKLPKELRRTLTMDNGSENTNHKIISQRLGLDVYYCHPYHAWERGTNENTIKYLRRFFPKHTSLDEVTEEEVAYVENWMNNLPRKVLGFLTPYEKMSQLLNSKWCTSA
ncbi:MAG: Transposase insI for insertion sequence element IS30B/C/D [Microgenomates group bacterium GW2011_GWA2_44_7]|nr:MAG: Transposase insI for insertion sequence element IS30B/C/D [Microgenomates group bacterium GW2011_GWA2_44_7]KKT78556.1 MAG: Transposase insI for insertion sequence element IS30B/C/D [Microgenomates group bacterium GW2011_GWB1_44_8]